MAINLLGEEYETLDEYAKRLVRIGFGKPTYKVRINSITYYPNRGIDISILDLDTNESPKGITNTGGIYSIWYGIPVRNNCLYVGGTSNRINDRIYKFMKELCNVSRDDECHPAAKKSRLLEYDPHNIYVTILPKHEFPPIRNDFIDINNDMIEVSIDEYVASILNPRFNIKVKQ